MPLLRVSDSSLLDQLIADLARRPDAIVARRGDSSVFVSIVGSFNTDAMEMAVLLRIRAWEEGQRANGVDVRVYIE